MTHEDFEKLIRDFFEVNCIGLMQKKSSEYSNPIFVETDDKLFNFKRAGCRRYKSPEEALAGMKEKHTTSIDNMIQGLEYRFQKYYKDGILLRITQEELDIWKEKLRDEINYLLLLWGLLNERLLKEPTKNEPKITLNVDGKEVKLDNNKADFNKLINSLKKIT